MGIRQPRTSAHPLRFGIPSVDELFPLSEPDACEKICIAGPDGTGKSILALHLASNYAAGYDSIDRLRGPRVVYVSTDMEFARARSIWRAFRLGFPGLRAIPFEKRNDREKRSGLHPVVLLPLRPGSDESIPKFLTRSSSNAAVGYLDLATHTAGDDWTYIARILKLGARAVKGEPRGLMVIDSVAGFETLVGGTDAFGQESSRRERIAQTIRAASERWHLVFVVEDPKPGEHSPEEFVTDRVIRVRRYAVGVHSRLTLEVEKSRSNRHARGQHPFEIRSGRGSCTGNWQNADDPKAIGRYGQPNAYVQVFPSLHRINQEISESQEKLPESYAPEDKALGFGINYLDDMLAKFQPKEGAERRGLAAGSVTALLGDDGTHKSMLGRYFLMGCFQDHARLLRAVLRLVLKGDGSLSEDDRVVLPWALKKFFGEKSPSTKGLRRLLRSAKGQDLFIKRVKTEALLRDVFADVYEQWFLGSDGQTARIERENLRKALSRRLRRVRDDELTRLVRAARRDRRSFLDACCEIFRRARPEPIKRKPWSRDETPRSRLRYPDDWYLGPFVEVGDAGEALQIVFLVNWLARHPLLVEPAVLLTTRDERAGILAKELAERIVKPVLREFDRFKGKNRKDNDFQEAFDACSRNIEGQIICRRLPIHDAPAPVLIHILEKSLDEAMRLRFGPDSEAIRHLDLSAYRAWKTRIVVDDVRVMAGMFPEVVEDRLFLPYTVFRLHRRGVTSLLIGTYPGRPDAQAADNVDADLRALTPHQIHTWKVSFHGRNRVAIGVIPAMSSAHSEFVRELKDTGTKGDIDLQVDPHFELYSGIEEGKPQAIPLEIRLFNETPAFEKYIAEEEGFWRQRFAPYQPANSAPQGVIKAVNAQELNDLRALCQLPKDETRPNTLLYQVDDYWARKGTGALMKRYTYLTEGLPQGPSKDEESDETSYVDPFRMFRTVKGGKPQENRLGYFKNLGYQPRIDGTEGDRVDRVPFMWDFGFLLCRQEAWKRAEEMPLGVLNESYQLRRTVGDVWSKFAGIRAKKHRNVETAAPTTKGGKTQPRDGLELTEWRPFLESCERVANAESLRLSQPVPVFDLSAISPDSVGCLVLEIWTSEIYQKLKRDLKKLPAFLEGVSSRQQYHEPRDQGLIEWLDEEESNKKQSLAAICRYKNPNRLVEHTRFFPELFKTWLLLTEALDFASFVGQYGSFQFPVNHPPNPNAVAARHWYKSACLQQTQECKAERQIFLPTALPGHFTTRGDWYLAVAAGSRSERLADLALDILSSRRGNFVRLQGGMGLPVRDLVSDDACAKIRTPIMLSHDPAEVATYGDIVGLGGICRGERRRRGQRKGMYWLWRSGLAEYDRQSRVWISWLDRLFEWTISKRSRPDSLWKGGFATYDMCANDRWKDVAAGDTLIEFAELCDILVAALKQASRP